MKDSLATTINQYKSGCGIYFGLPSLKKILIFFIVNIIFLI